MPSRTPLRWREQVILLINRRAWAMFVMCRKCGTAIKCNQCAVSLAYHKADALLRCHHCDYSIPLPDKCPTCQTPNPLPFGLGTERVEEEVGRLFPDARILRMDRDTTQRQGGAPRTTGPVSCARGGYLDRHPDGGEGAGLSERHAGGCG